MAVDYSRPADLFPSRRYAKALARYKRFDTTADAVRYVIEDMPEAWLVGSALDEAVHHLLGGFEAVGLDVGGLHGQRQVEYQHARVARGIGRIRQALPARTGQRHRIVVDGAGILVVGRLLLERDEIVARSGLPEAVEERPAAESVGIAMDDAVPVRLAQEPGDVAGDGDRLPRGELGLALEASIDACRVFAERPIPSGYEKWFRERQRAYRERKA